MMSLLGIKFTHLVFYQLLGILFTSNVSLILDPILVPGLTHFFSRRTCHMCSLWSPSQSPTATPQSVSIAELTELRKETGAVGNQRHLLTFFLWSRLGSAPSFSGLHFPCHHKSRCSEHFCYILRMVFQKEFRRKTNKQMKTK